MSNALVRTALETHLSTWAAARVPAIDSVAQIAWENAAFNPPEGLWLRAHLMPAETGDPSLGQAHRRYAGLFQVDVYAPAGVGPAEGEGIANELEKLFHRGLILTRAARKVAITRTPEIASGRNGDDGYFIPVRIRYRCDVIDA